MKLDNEMQEKLNSELLEIIKFGDVATSDGL